MRESAAPEAAGASCALSTPPAGRNGLPITNTTSDMAKTAVPITIVGRGATRLCFKGPLGRAAAPTVANAAIDAPHPGHAPSPPTQHRSHAWTPQEAQRRRPTWARLATGPMRLPHRSQNGIRGPPEGGRAHGTCGVWLTYRRR